MIFDITFYLYFHYQTVYKQTLNEILAVKVFPKYLRFSITYPARFITYMFESDTVLECTIDLKLNEQLLNSDDISL